MPAAGVFGTWGNEIHLQAPLVRQPGRGRAASPTAPQAALQRFLGQGEGHGWPACCSSSRGEPQLVDVATSASSSMPAAAGDRTGW